ncbi:MAG TPA: helix-turn-helix transcriptional regulator [Nevskiaceae bacterium]
MGVRDMRAVTRDEGAARDAFLEALGERVRTLRARRGLTRKGLSQAAGVSERHLASLEQGVGNASILILREVAHALSCPLPELLGDETAVSPEWLLLRDLLRNRSVAELQRARLVLAPLFGAAPEAVAARLRRIALIGLRGGGKSTLGARLAAQLDVPFMEINREIERIAGGSVSGIYDLYGAGAYHRYEQRVLEEIIRDHEDVVIATPGSIVSEASTFSLLLSHCYTVWIQASPEEHMARVVAQGDLRPMGGNVDHTEAMEDLRRILAGREAFYGKADLRVDTTGLDVDQAFDRLRSSIDRARAGLTVADGAADASRRRKVDPVVDMQYSA